MLWFDEWNWTAISQKNTLQTHAAIVLFQVQGPQDLLNLAVPTLYPKKAPQSSTQHIQQAVRFFPPRSWETGCQLNRAQVCAIQSGNMFKLQSLTWTMHKWMQAGDCVSWTSNTGLAFFVKN